MSTKALVIVDLQNDYYEGGRWTLYNINQASTNAQRVLADAREQGMPVIHVHHEFEIENPPFFEPGTFGAEIHKDLTPLKGEATVLKHQVNSFQGTDLKARLDALGVADVILVGAMSHMCIDAAARAAADFGYQVTVVEDACASRDLEFNGEVVPAPQVHAAYMSALGFAYANVVTTNTYLG